MTKPAISRFAPFLAALLIGLQASPCRAEGATLGQNELPIHEIGRAHV